MGIAIYASCYSQGRGFWASLFTSGQTNFSRVFFLGSFPVRSEEEQDQTSLGSRRPKAVVGDAREVGSPMPGLIVTVAVRAGDTISRGQKLLSLEAMKMETTVYAERDGKIAEVLVSPGTPVEAGELVARYADA